MLRRQYSRKRVLAPLVTCVTCLFLSWSKMMYDSGAYSMYENVSIANIYVYAPGFDENCGGCTVLHYLVDRLNVWFEDTVRAYLVPYGYPLKKKMATNNGYKTPLLPEWKSIDDGYVIYPESMSGNPLNATNVVRWILYFPGVHGGPNANEYSTKDLIACYSIGVCEGFDENVYDKYLLKLVDYGLEHLDDLPKRHHREGTLVHHKKRKWRSESSTSIELVKGDVLGNNLSKHARLTLFSKYERCITTDPATFISVEAAMAGCLSIVVPFENVSKEEWQNTAYGKDDFKFGVAYGEGEIPYALKTLPLVVPNLREQERKQRLILQNFLQTLNEFFPSSNNIQSE